MHPFFEGLSPTLHISHRGGAALWPENTLYAFQRAVEDFQTDMLELDLHRTRDGVLVVSHDATVERCTDGGGALRTLTLAQVERLDAGHAFTPDEGRTYPYRGQGLRLPTFHEVLKSFPSMRLNVEIKEDAPGIEHAFAQAVREAGALGRVCFGSEHDALAERLHQALPEGCLFYPRDALTQLVLALHQGEPPPDEPRYTVLDMPLTFGDMRLLTPDFLAACTRQDKWINVWTIDDEEEMRRLVQEGVGGIMTDHPERLRRVLTQAAAPRLRG